MADRSNFHESLWDGSEWNCNQILSNIIDKKAIMVSFNPRIDGKWDGRFKTTCDKGGSTVAVYQEGGDFWVKSPLQDVNADLQQYVTSSPTQVYGGAPEDSWKYALWPVINNPAVSSRATQMAGAASSAASGISRRWPGMVKSISAMADACRSRRCEPAETRSCSGRTEIC